MLSFSNHSAAAYSDERPGGPPLSRARTSAHRTRPTRLSSHGRAAGPLSSPPCHTPLVERSSSQPVPPAVDLSFLDASLPSPPARGRCAAPASVVTAGVSPPARPPKPVAQLAVHPGCAVPTSAAVPGVSVPACHLERLARPVATPCPLVRCSHAVPSSSIPHGLISHPCARHPFSKTPSLAKSYVLLSLAQKRPVVCLPGACGAHWTSHIPLSHLPR